MALSNRIVVLHHGQVISAGTPEQVTQDPAVLELGRRISLVPDPTLDWKTEMPPGRVEIVSRDGRSWLREGRQVPGNGDNPMSWTDICDKFRECAGMAAVPPSGEKVARALDLAGRLESLPDATELARALA